MSTLSSDADLHHRVQLLEIREKQAELREQQIANEQAATKAKEEQLKIKEERHQSKIDLFELEMKRREDELQTQRQELMKLIQAQQDSFHLLPNTNDDFFESLTLGLEPYYSSSTPTLGKADIEMVTTKKGVKDDDKMQQLKMISKQVQNRYDDAVRVRDDIIRKGKEVDLALAELTMAKEQFKLDCERKEGEDESKAMELEIKSKMLDEKLATMTQIGTGMGLTNVYEFIINSQKRLDVIKVLGLSGNDAFTALVEMTDDEFNSTYHLDRLVLCQQYAMDPTNSRRMLTMSSDEFQSQPIQDKLLVIRCRDEQIKHGGTGLMSPLSHNIIFGQSDYEFAASELYRTYMPYRGLVEKLKENLRGWGKGLTDSLFEFRFLQLQKQVHYNYYTFISLIDALYPRDGTGTHNKFTNPLNSSVSDSNATMFGYFLKPLYKDGTIPKLTPSLKLFFSTQHIANGDWIQFHGPGMFLDRLGGNDFPLTLSSLCPKEKKGSFTSLHSKCGSKGNFSQSNETSKYSISIKWE